MMTCGNKPAILAQHYVAMAARALPGSKVPCLKVTIVHKVTLVVTDVLKGQNDIPS